eukprot:1021393-Amphidinium_carterae.1
MHFFGSYFAINADATASDCSGLVGTSGPPLAAGGAGGGTPGKKGEKTKEVTDERWVQADTEGCQKRCDACQIPSDVIPQTVVEHAVAELVPSKSCGHSHSNFQCGASFRLRRRSRDTILFTSLTHCT